MSRLIQFKERTFGKIARYEEMEQTIKDLTMKEATEYSSKEAMYAMNARNPLKLYDCLIPEITAYRPMRI